MNTFYLNCLNTELCTKCIIILIKILVTQIYSHMLAIEE